MHGTSKKGCRGLCAQCVNQCVIASTIGAGGLQHYAAVHALHQSGHNTLAATSDWSLLGILLAATMQVRTKDIAHLY